MVRKSYPVTICVFMNHFLFYGSKKTTSGDDEYDHIVSISKIVSHYDDGNRADESPFRFLFIADRI